MSKRNIVIIVITFFTIVACYFFGLLPIVTEDKNDIVIEEINLNKGEQYNPLDKFDFDNGNYKLYYIQSIREKEGFFKVLYTDDKMKLKSVKKSFNCSYTDGDISTYESKIILLKNEKTVLEMYIGLDNQPFGVQNQEFGWLTIKDKKKLADELKGLDAYLSPWLSL